jgi:hypothetical protein
MKPDVFFAKLEYQATPLTALTDFLEAEGRFEQARQTDKMRFVGYVLEIGYDTATIITSDPYKVAVGGIPRGSFLILAPQNLHRLPPHFTLLRVLETAPTPLSVQVQQTYFELHKKSMPELDVWTQGELQWGALKCAVLGMFYPNRGDSARVDFSGDVNNVVSAHRYRVYAPDAALLDLIVNGLVRPKTDEPLPIGQLRPTENQLASILGADSGNEMPATTVKISMDDFKGARTAMFGKTRLGKSNVVKLLVQAMIDATQSDKTVGQLIFDINGEYANDNPQNLSIRTVNPAVCNVYALTKRPNTPSNPLRINFYENPAPGIEILGSMLEQDNRKSIYIEKFASVTLPSIEDMIQETDISAKNRGIRKIQAYWAILQEAGFRADEMRMKNIGGGFRTSSSVGIFDPHFNQVFRAKVYGKGNEPGPPQSLDELVSELKTVIKYARDKPDDDEVKKQFKPDDWALFDFLVPVGRTSAGPGVVSRYRTLHDPEATDFETEIIDQLDHGRTVILDLGNANDRIRSFFADMLSRAVFRHQEDKFSDDKLGEHFIQLYFEEAHNLFPATAKDLTGVYARFAKEGAKFHIGMTYSTQSPSTIYGELLAQTENFFIGHLSSSQETSALVKLQRAFSGVEEEIMRSRTPGYMRMLTQSHRFVIPVQARLFEARGGA